MAAGYVLRCVSQRISTAKLFEANQIGMLVTQSEEQIGFGFKTIVRTVVDDRRQLWRRGQDLGEMRVLSSRR